jgi:FkbM family methyltransferase
LNFVFMRDKSDDHSIWRSVVLDDEYRIPELKPEDRVLDIGMHTGSFVARAFIAGSRQIYGFEADRENFEYAVSNVSGITDQLFNAAVVRCDERSTDPVFISGHVPMSHELNTGVGNIFAEKGTPVRTAPFDDIVNQLGEVRLVKMDIEGGEWPIFWTSKRLMQCAEFVGEWHLNMGAGFEEKQGLPLCTLAALCEHMKDQGFAAHCFARGEDLPSPLAGNFHFFRRDMARGDSFERDLAGGRETMCASGF